MNKENDRLYDTFMNLVGSFSNKQLEKLANGLMEYVENDRELETAKEEYMQVDINLLSETIDSLDAMIDYADDGILSRYDSEYKGFFESVDKARETLEKLNKLYVER